MNIRICPLPEEQISAAAALEALCFTDGVSEESLRSFVCTACNHYLAALTEEGALPGYGGFSVVADEAEIITVAVSPASRRCGIGRALTEQMLHDAEVLGAASMYLEVRASNSAARALYTALGFEEIGVRRGYYRAPREDAILMRREYPAKNLESGV